ncbi:MAG: hypothetical protein J6C81_05525 [Muribaculaceae bacterium]|nr:hypothetical protein [Muribaculaceae bacterium]
MKSKLEKIAGFFSDLSRSTASLAKILILSRSPFRKNDISSERPIVILGNGPSLNDTVENHPEFLADKDLLAVNFAANTPYFEHLKPNRYVIADPGFFTLEGYDKIPELWKNISAATWHIDLFVPAKYISVARSKVTCRNVTVHPFNMTPIEGFYSLRRFAYKRGLGLPRPRNVLIPSIMTAIRAGYKDIFIAGADHSWSKTLWVDDKNRVVTIQPHFYPDDEKEQERVTQAYAGIHLHDIYTSFAVAFRSYFDIARFASDSGVSVINITPGSFIDAFPRQTIKTPEALCK